MGKEKELDRKPYFLSREISIQLTENQRFATDIHDTIASQNPQISSRRS